MDKPLNGQIAVIVGASSGMGRATAVSYAEAGASVVVAARNGEKLEALAAEIGDQALVCQTEHASQNWSCCHQNSNEM